MSATPRPARRWLKILVTVIAVLTALVTSFTWPKLIVSSERELTGRSIRFVPLASVPLPGREGIRAEVYALPAEATDALAQDGQRLAGYPMWSALAFDGYQLVRWRSLDQLRQSPHPELIQWFADPGRDMEPARIRTNADAMDLARHLARQDGALVAAWYTTRDGTLTNYFIYVLDLRRRLLIEIQLLT